jgi:hypothetical protein
MIVLMICLEEEKKLCFEGGKHSVEYGPGSLTDQD